MKNPYLIQGRRFSMRMYTTIIRNTTKTYSGYFSSELFIVMLTQDKDSPFAKETSIISNTHFNTDIVNVYTNQELFQQLQEANLLDKWYNKTIPAIRSGLGEFLKRDTQVIGKNGTPNLRFELYGCDILIDDSLRPWLLECNRCAGLVSLLGSRSKLFQELLYILMHSFYVAIDVPNLQYWNSVW